MHSRHTNRENFQLGLINLLKELFNFQVDYSFHFSKLLIILSKRLNFREQRQLTQKNCNNLSYYI